MPVVNDWSNVYLALANVNRRVLRHSAARMEPDAASVRRVATLTPRLLSVPLTLTLSRRERGRNSRRLCQLYRLSGRRPRRLFPGFRKIGQACYVRHTKIHPHVRAKPKLLTNRGTCFDTRQSGACHGSSRDDPCGRCGGRRLLPLPASGVGPVSARAGRHYYSYVCPRPVPPLVGYTYITYPPLAPHQFLGCCHSESYKTCNCDGSVTHTSICYNHCLCGHCKPTVMWGVPVPCTLPARPGSMFLMPW